MAATTATMPRPSLEIEPKNIADSGIDRAATVAMSPFLPSAFFMPRSGAANSTECKHSA